MPRKRTEATDIDHNVYPKLSSFPRERFLGMDVVLPKLEFQKQAAKLYNTRDVVLRQLGNFEKDTTLLLNRLIEIKVDRKRQGAEPSA